MVVVRPSPIHGKGLFATREIRRGELIGRIKGKKTRRNGPYVLWISEHQGIEVEGVLKYINHAERPNAAYYDDLTVVALRRIREGEEITHCYGENWRAEK